MTRENAQHRTRTVFVREKTNGFFFICIKKKKINKKNDIKKTLGFRTVFVFLFPGSNQFFNPPLDDNDAETPSHIIINKTLATIVSYKSCKLELQTAFNVTNNTVRGANTVIKSFNNYYIVD